MLASTRLDPVLGIDTHIVLVPAPPGPPVPTPWPHPFIGLVLDMGDLITGVLPFAAEMVAGVADTVTGAGEGGQHGALGAGLVACSDAVGTLHTAYEWLSSPVSSAFDWAAGEIRGSSAANAGKVKINGLWATLGGGSATAIPGHIPSPFPFATPPDNDAEFKMGAAFVFFEGHAPVRLMDVAESCGDPVRMPTSMVLAVPKGFPVLIPMPMAPDLLTLLSDIVGNYLQRHAARVWRAVGRTRWMRSLRARAKRLASRMTKPGRIRSRLHSTICHLTGEPIDVATGRVLSKVPEFELPGPIPLRFERCYDSSLGHRDSVVGYGWSHTFDQALWEEPGRLVLRGEDGREVEFDTLDLRGGRLEVGQSVYSELDRILVVRRRQELWEVHTPDDRVREFVGHPQHARLTRIRTRSGCHSIELTYDSMSKLECVRDSAGRLIRFEYDARGRLSAIRLPVPHGRGWYVHSRFEYDDCGDLVRAIDPKGAARTYAYVNHLNVRKTDRSGLTFYYEYDGVDAAARCTRSWGDGGILHRVFHYLPSKGTTLVEDSYGRPTKYVMDDAGIVEEVTDPLGARTVRRHDPVTGRLLEEIDAMGATTRHEWDPRGNRIATHAPDGATTRWVWDADDQLVRVVSPGGAEWNLVWDPAHQLVEMRDPLGAITRYQWSRGILVGVHDSGGGLTSIEYDERSCPSRTTLPNGAEVRTTFDEVGRLIKTRNALGGVEQIRYDALGLVVWTQRFSGVVAEAAYDAEENVVEVREATRRVEFGYSHLHELAWRREAGTTLTLERDLEGRVTALINEGGERYVFVLDAAGRVSEEVEFDGATRRYTRDASGRPMKLERASGLRTSITYEAAGRPARIEHSDGTFASFEYDAEGALRIAENESTRVEYERDLLGRIVSERSGGREVRSTYDTRGQRTSIETTLGAHVEIECDPLGDVRALQMCSSDPRLTDARVEFERDAIGLEQRRRFSNGVELEWQRDLAGRPLSRRTFRNGALSAAAAALGLVGAFAAMPPIASADSRELLDSRVYEWRGEDQIASITRLGVEARLFEHDARGSLIRERRGDVAVDRVSDAVGNIYRSADGRDRRYGASGKLIEEAAGTRYTYDADGNRISRIGDDGEWHYVWNGHGHLREVTRPDGTVVRFEYDAFARRIRKEVGNGPQSRVTEFVWDGHNVVHELEGAQLTTWHWLPGTFEPVAQERHGSRWSIATDQVGTPTEMHDELGALAWQMQLDVFGVARIDRAENAECPWRWPGQQADEETGLYYNRNRYFDPKTCGYLSKDPIGLAGGTSLYAYVPDPLFWTDPLGLSKERCLNGDPVRDPGLEAFVQRLRAAGIDVRSLNVVIHAPGGATSLAEIDVVTSNAIIQYKDGSSSAKAIIEQVHLTEQVVNRPVVAFVADSGKAGRRTVKLAGPHIAITSDLPTLIAVIQ